MPDIRKLLDIVTESSSGGTSAGSVAPMAQSFHTEQRRVDEEKPEAPEVIEYGMWENSALATTSKLKKARSKSSKVVKSIYGVDTPAKKQGVSEGKFTVNARTGAKLHPRTGEGSTSKEKQKTPYRDINSPEYKAAAEKQKQQMAKDQAAEPGKKLLGKIEKKGVAEGSDAIDRTVNTFSNELFNSGFTLISRTGVIGSKKAGQRFQYSELYRKTAAENDYTKDEIDRMEARYNDPQYVEQAINKSKVQEKFGIQMIPLQQGVAAGTQELGESDLILNPASISKAVRGLVPHSSGHTDHEIEMAKSDLYQAGKNAARVYELIKDRSEEEGLEGWVQEKIVKAADYLNTIAEYLEGKQLESMDGVSPSTKMFTSESGVEEGKTGPGLWPNIHAKRNRIKNSSGERMRKPGSKGAPTAANFKAAKAGSK